MYPSCILCGVSIEGARPSWRSEFRAIYGEQGVWHEPSISGVGDRAIDDRVPVDFNAHRSDHALEPQDLRNVFFFQTLFPRITTYDESQIDPDDPPDPASILRPHTVWGFPAHVSCWTLLSHVSYPREVDVDRLSSLCHSSPYQSGGSQDFGLDYGNVFKYGKTFRTDWTFSDEDLPLFPGEERKINEELTRIELHHSPNADIYYADPLQIPGLVRRNAKLLEVAKLHEPEFPVEDCCCETNQSQYVDCFTRLPDEILEHFLCYLPSEDVVKLKVASAAFASTALSERFWASRFHWGSEFHCLFNSRGDSMQKINWKASYMQAKSIQQTLSYRNRERIWKILLQIDEVLLAMSQSNLHGVPMRSSFEEDGPEDTLTWRRSCSRSIGPSEHFGRGCRALYTRNVTMPLRLSGISVAFIKLGDVTYVSGIRFCPKFGSEVEIGYTNPDRERWLEIGDMKAQKISGFKLAIDSRGIRAIGVLLGQDFASEMVLYCKAPKMLMKAATDEDFMSLKCDFDGLKMVSLAVPEHNREVAGDFRDDFLWFPVPPESDLLLSESCSSNQYTNYRTLTTCLFGGLDGTLLQHLAEIAVFEYNNTIWGIEFRYTIDVGGRKNLVLGRPWPFDDPLPNTYSHQRLRQASERNIFIVDGPGGEIITGIDVHTEIAVGCLRIHTNRGRSMFFPREPELAYFEGLTPVSVPGSTIIGFYAELETIAVLKSLGTISKNF